MSESSAPPELDVTGFDAIYAKTDAGHREVAERKENLAQKLSSLLVLVDGKTPLAQFSKMRSYRDIRELIATLEDRGLVHCVQRGVDLTATQRMAAVSASQSGAHAHALAPADTRFGTARGFMLDGLANAAGEGVERLRVKITECPTLEELIKLQPDFHAVLAGQIGRKAALERATHLQKLIG